MPCSHLCGLSDMNAVCSIILSMSDRYLHTLLSSNLDCLSDQRKILRRTYTVECSTLVGCNQVSGRSPRSGCSLATPPAHHSGGGAGGGGGGGGGTLSAGSILFLIHLLDVAYTHTQTDKLVCVCCKGARPTNAVVYNAVCLKD